MARLKRVQLIILLSVVVAGLIVAGAFYYTSQLAGFVESQEGELNIIADLKTEQIAQWYQNQIHFVNHISESSVLLQKDFEQPGEAVDLMIEHANLFRGFDGVCLYDRSGGLIASSRERRAWPQEVLKAIVPKAIERREIQFSDLFVDDTRPKEPIRMVFAAPILTEGIIPDVLGVVAVVIDPYKELYPLIQTWPLPSDSAEILMVRREGDEIVFLNELRHQKDTALKLTRSVQQKNLPAAWVVQGETKVGQGVDYRGIPVVATGRPVPGTSWFIVVKTDAEEFFQPFRKSATRIITIFSLLILLAGGIAFIFHMNNQAYARKEEMAKARALNEELERRIHERTMQLEKAVIDLKASNKNLEAFSYSVSHDLRAPLRGIDGFSQALLEDYKDALDEQGQEYLNRLRAAAQRMAELIDDLLQLSRVSLSPMNFEKVDLSKMAAEIAAEMMKADPEAEAVAEIEPDITGFGDARLLRIVLVNLISNAWKFSGKSPNPRIGFSAASDGETQTFTVRDNGVGFDEKYVDKLFQPFQRLHSSKDFPGTGIGLATVDRIIRRHGGTVRAQSSPGGETRFSFTLKKGDA
jgi:signal transduction histidine kinase